MVHDGVVHTMTVRSRTARAMRMTRVLLIAIVLCIALVLLSWVTTVHEWYGLFPKGVWLIRVVDSDGNAISGANLSILRSGRTAVVSPFDNCSVPGSILSDGNGVIGLTNQRSGPGYGGRAWLLLWAIPMGVSQDRPEFDLVVRCDGYEPAVVSSERLLQMGRIEVELARSK